MRVAKADQQNGLAHFQALVGFTSSTAHLSPDTNEFSTCDWQSLKELARFHRVEALVNLEQTLVPEIIAMHFTLQRRNVAMKTLEMAYVSLEISGALRAANIPSLLLKGWAVSSRYYEYPERRQSIDSDLLIEPSHVRAAHHIVNQLGFEEVFPNVTCPDHCHDVLLSLTNSRTYLRRKDGAQLDLHWKLNNASSLLGWHPGDLISEAEELGIGDQTVLVLPLEKQFIYLCTHGAKHGWFRLKWLADIEHMLPFLSDSDCRKIRNDAEGLGVWHMMAASLLTLEAFYGCKINVGFDLANPDRKDRRLANVMKERVARSWAQNTSVRFRDVPTAIRALLYTVNLKASANYKAEVLFMRLTDPRDIPTLRLSKKWLPLYAILGPFLAFTRIAAREIEAHLNRRTKNPKDESCDLL